MTQKELISQLEFLKQIKPRKEWVILLKSQILAEEQETIKIPAPKISIFNVILNSKFYQILNSRKLAYSFAVLLFVVIGLIGFAQYTVPGDLLFPIKKISEQSQASLTGQTILRQDITKLSNRINDLAQLAKQGRTNNIPSAISEINANVKELANNLKSNNTDADTIKEIAMNLKVLAAVPGTDMSESPDVKDLYQTIVASQIADLEKSTLTQEQEETLGQIKSLYEQGEYVDALEKILLINLNNG